MQYEVDSVNDSQPNFLEDSLPKLMHHIELVSGHKIGCR